MTDFRDLEGEQRYEQMVHEPDGRSGRVWADYSVQGEGRTILHVEAEDTLRGTGAAGRFMQGLADHVRAAGVTLTPRCSYAVAWFKRHPDQSDVVA